MEGTKEFFEIAKKFMEGYCRGELEDISKYCTKDVEVITPYFRRCGKLKRMYGESENERNSIVHRNYRLIYRSPSTGIVTGGCNLEERKKDIEFTIIINQIQKQNKIKHVHISEHMLGKYFQIRDIKEQVYHIHETEIEYVEAFHNHVLWHCQDSTVEAVGKLSEVQKILSEDFIRIHRSYIVNCRHVGYVARCYVKLDNGEELQIPVKKYCEVKKMLAKGSNIIPIP